LQIIYADIGTEGASNDAGIYNRSSLKTALDAGQLNIPCISSNESLDVPYHFIGDDAFALCDTVMKPYPNKSQNERQRVFNYRLSRARRVVENSFGIMSSRYDKFLNNQAFN